MRTFRGTGKVRYFEKDVIYKVRPVERDGTLEIIDEDNDVWGLEDEVPKLIRCGYIEEVKRPPLEENE